MFRLDRMPIFGWYILVTAMMMIVAFPPLILGSILLECERAFGLRVLRSDPWRRSRCSGSISSGCSATRTSTSSSCPWPGRFVDDDPGLRRPSDFVGYRAIVVAIIALAFLSFGIWVHHMFTVGIPHLALAFFSAGSAIVAVPTAVQMFAWLATLSQGQAALETCRCSTSSASSSSSRSAA